MTPDDLTLRSIELNGGFTWSSTPIRRAKCGCEVRRDTMRYRLCQYHEGFDDGAEAARTAT